MSDKKSLKPIVDRQKAEVIWFHNYSEKRQNGTFFWDIYDRASQISEINIKLKGFPVIRSFQSVRDCLKLISIFKKEHIVHGQFGSLIGLFTAIQRCDLRILTLRGSDIYWDYGTIFDKIGAFLRVAMSWFCCVRSDSIIVMSQAMAERVKSWPLVASWNVHVLVDPAGELFWPENAREISDELYNSKFKVVIASLAEINPVKRTEIVTEAARLCDDIGMSIRLIRLSGLSRVTVKKVVEEADSVALSSTHEGWPNIIKESLLLGKKFVATDVSDLKVFALPGSDNIIVPPNSLAFAFAWVDQISSQVLTKYGVSQNLVQFHPDVCVLKHNLLYAYYRKGML